MEVSRWGSRGIEIWEPLRTKAPGPHLSQPYCCYAQTVIFYVRGYIIRPWHHFWRDGKGKLRAEKPGRTFEEWDRIETDLTWNTPVQFEGKTFLCGGGRVVWHRKQWHMRRLAFLAREGEKDAK